MRENFANLALSKSFLKLHDQQTQPGDLVPVQARCEREEVDRVAQADDVSSTGFDGGAQYAADNGSNGGAEQGQDSFAAAVCGAS